MRPNVSTILIVFTLSSMHFYCSRNQNQDLSQSFPLNTVACEHFLWICFCLFATRRRCLIDYPIRGHVIFQAGLISIPNIFFCETDTCFKKLRQLPFYCLLIRIRCFTVQFARLQFNIFWNPNGQPVENFRSTREDSRSKLLTSSNYRASLLW